MRETFHIFWAFTYIIFIHVINKQFKKNLITILLITVFILPLYLKNFFLYNQFAISLTSFEHLSQKIEFVKKMKTNEQHKKIRDFIFNNKKESELFFSSMSKIFYIDVNSNPDTYKEILNYEYKYNNQLLKSNTSFNEVYIKVDEVRKTDFMKVLKNYPELLLISISNSALRHFFRSSDTFYFTRFNADKIPTLIRLSHCIKITLACIYEFPFDKVKFKINDMSFMKINDNNFSYMDRIKFSLNDMNFLIIFIYFYVMFSLVKCLINKQKLDNISKLVNFWVSTFIIIFLLLVLFEDGEIPRHRYPFDYIMIIFSLYYNKLNSSIFNETKKNI